MQTFRTPQAPSGAELLQAAVVGVVAGTVSAGLRWALYRYESTRRRQKLEAAAKDAAKSFGEALAEATKGLERIVQGGRVAPPDISGQLRIDGPIATTSVNADGSFTVPGSPDLDKIMEDLNRVQRGGEAPQG
jgi:hypothetical protein